MHGNMTAGLYMQMQATKKMKIYITATPLALALAPPQS